MPTEKDRADIKMAVIYELRLHFGQLDKSKPLTIEEIQQILDQIALDKNAQ